MKTWVKHTLTIMLHLIVLTFFLLSACSELAFDPETEIKFYEYTDNTEWGPYPVGVTTRFFVDESRDAKYTDKEGDKRMLVTEIWYPATAETASMQTDNFLNAYSPFQDEVIPFVSDLANVPEEELETDIPTSSVRDAQITMEQQKFPLAIFTHGNGGIRIQSLYITEYLASHGYIVISADHTGSSIVSIVENEAGDGYQLMGYKEGTLLDYTFRVADITFLIDKMTELNENDPSGLLTGRLDLDGITCMGHSLGGITTCKSIESDDRIKAGVPMAGSFAPSNSYTVPMMYMYATDDRTIPEFNSVMITIYNDKSAASKFLLEHVDAGHFSFSNMCDLIPTFGDGCGEEFMDYDTAHRIGRQYITAFYGYYIKGIQQYKSFLMENHFEGDLNYEYVMR